MGIRVLVAKFLWVMPCTLILHEPFCSWSLLACCIFYTFQNLDPPNLELGACCVYYTHAQHWFSKFWSLGHVLYLHMPNRDPPTLGACSMLFILTRPTLFLQFSELWGMLDILHMPSLYPLNFGDWACCTLTHAQFWYPNFGACGMMYIWHMPTLILQNFGAWSGFYM